MLDIEGSEIYEHDKYFLTVFGDNDSDLYQYEGTVIFENCTFKIKETCKSLSFFDEVMVINEFC